MDAQRFIRRICCATDFSAGARAAFEYAVSLSEPFEARIALLHALKPPDFVLPELSVSLGDGGPRRGETFADFMQREALAKSEGLLAELPASVRERISLEVQSGSPGPVIVEHAERTGCDLIVMGTHGWTGLAHFFLGSVATHVVRHASCAVLTVRAVKR